jgi:hypothetical protein
LGGEAVVADAADFGARDSDLHTEVAGDLILKLFVEARLEFANLATAEAGDVDVVARAVGFVVVAITAEMKKIELVDEALFLEKVDGAVDGDEMDFRTDFLGALEDLIHVEVLLGVIHDLEDDTALTGKANALLAKGFLERTGGLGGVEAFTGRDAMGWSSGHGKNLER